MITKIYSLALMAVIVSFLGFLVENIWLILTKGFCDNRNMKLPFLLGYGLFIIGLYIFLGTPDSFIINSVFVNNQDIGHIVYFIIVFLIVSIGEVLLGTFTEKYFKFYYWNYEKIPMHITRYTSIPTSLGFTIIIMFFMQECFTPIYNFIYNSEKLSTSSISIILITILTIDFFTSFYKMHKTNKQNIRWRYYVNKTEKEKITN